MASSLVYITEARVRELLDWESTFTAVETALVAVAQKRAIQTARTFTQVLGTRDVLLCMPGYLQNSDSGTLACKMVTSFMGNTNRSPPLPSILANICLFDSETGTLKCVIQGTEITAWRTAAASVVATKYLHLRSLDRANNILAILGAGTQGRIHAIAFQHIFKFKEVRIWNHREEKAKALAEELTNMGIPAKQCQTPKDCVTNADVIVTATYASSPIVNFEWVKENVHINAVGAGISHHSELDESMYKNSIIYVDHMEGAAVELKGLEDIGVEIRGEIGDIITKDKPMPDANKITIFQSLGMAAEDAAVGQYIYDRHINS